MLDCIQSIRFLWRKPFVAYLLLKSICSSDYEILLLIPTEKKWQEDEDADLVLHFPAKRRKMYDG